MKAKPTREVSKAVQERVLEMLTCAALDYRDAKVMQAEAEAKMNASKQRVDETLEKLKAEMFAAPTPEEGRHGV
jgi:F0F1-type ATP synthase membrane subunit b/b'